MLIVNSFGPTKLVPFAPDHARVACRKKDRRCIEEIRLRVLFAAMSHGQASNNNAVPHATLDLGVALRLLEPFRSSGVKLWYDSHFPFYENRTGNQNQSRFWCNPRQQQKQQHPIGGKELQNYVMRDDRGFAPCACKMHHNVVTKKFDTYCDCSRPWRNEKH